MQRVDTITALEVQPADEPGGTPGFFTKGDPSQGVNATVPGQDWFNSVQEELCNLIVQSGLTLDKVDRTQLYQAIILLTWSSLNDGIGSGLDADLLHGQPPGFYRDASNLNAGLLPLARFPAELVGKSAQSLIGLISAIDELNILSGAVINTEELNYLKGLSATYYDLKHALYKNKSLNLSAQAAVPTGLRFSPDGLTLYVVENDGDKIVQYALTYPRDPDTAVYTGKFFSVLGQANYANGIDISPDGTTVYVTSAIPSAVYQYTMLTPGDISTASYTGKSYTIVEDSGVGDIFVTDDGSNMYLIGETNEKIYQYSLTPGDIDTIVYTGKSLSVAGQMTRPHSFMFSKEGTRIFAIGLTADAVYEYILTTAFDLNTGAYANRSFSVAAQQTNPTGIVFSPSGGTMFIVGYTPPALHEYRTNHIDIL